MTNSDGMIALGPLAVSVLAKQSSMDVQVESEYLPQHLLSRDCGFPRNLSSFS
ncbi:Imm49 family immunity protein [Saccharopolyspora pogona]|uniref:Imm49 family immunity protein n=1 Tax=Saccharopolyspora pogona TaxID=333966 RepID=UPI001682A59A